MCWLYVLQNPESKRYYIGSTNDLDRRLKQHRRGKNITSNRLGTMELVYSEEFKNLIDARNREKKLKSYKSHKYIDWLIQKMAR